ncbi:MAG: hypothetical protein R2852_01395 [Bacteroidia bacterium]
MIQVVKDLNAYYKNINLQVDPNVADCRLTATFEKENLSNVLKVIEATMSIQIEEDKLSGVIKLKGEGCNK